MWGVFMNSNILVVDDEHEIADLLEVYLMNENFTVYKCYSASEALACIESCELDLAVLDIMLPDISGFTILTKIRERHNFPVIMLTAKDEETDKITGLTLGADDYITKPFRPLEAIARVKAQLRRYKKYNSVKEDEQQEYIMTCGELNLNTRSHECLLNDRVLPLTPTEFSILRILLERRGYVVSAEDLFHSIWQDEYYTKNNNTITVHIRHLREKMGESTENPKYIKTVWGVGYKIEK
jgi:two-component system response regulator VanR